MGYDRKIKVAPDYGTLANQSIIDCFLQISQNLCLAARVGPGGGQAGGREQLPRVLLSVGGSGRGNTVGGWGYRGTEIR